MPRDLPTAELLCKLLRYDPETGKLFWRERGVEYFKGRERCRCSAWNTRYAGREAFTVSRGGYLSGKIFGKPYYAQRVIWAMVTGSWPVNLVDHEDTNRRNNRFSNLREATNAENLCNRGGDTNSSSSFCGVSWHKGVGKWMARIYSSGRHYHLGYHPIEEDAARAYDAVARERHGEFARLNFP